MKGKPFKPMLAVTCEDVSKIKFPVYASLKIDGIRASIHNGVVMSRSMKPIPSPYVQAKFGKPEYEGFDGELVCGDLLHKDVFNRSTRACMSSTLPEGFTEADLKFYVFDAIGDGLYIERIGFVVLSSFAEKSGVEVLKQCLIEDVKQLNEYEKSALDSGAEGVMLRSLGGKYKQGRSTVKEGYLLKLKRFSDSEAEVIGFEEKMHNANEATVGELGQTKRSSHKENMVPMDTLGSLVVRDIYSGVEFNIGTGFDDKLRKEIWDNKEDWLTKIVKYKHFEIGKVDKPRFPVYLGEAVFVGERMLEDM